MTQFNSDYCDVNLKKNQALMEIPVEGHLIFWL